MPVYLIHFETPYKHARHYLGSTDNLSRRLFEHATGTGARLMQVIQRAGIRYHVAKVWQGEDAWKQALVYWRHCPLPRILQDDLEWEYALKTWKNSPKLCSTCRQERLYQRTLTNLRREEY